MMNEIILPVEDFSVEILQDKYINGPLKDYADCLNYIYEYYYEVAGGMYYFYNKEQDEFIFKTRIEFKYEVIDKIDDQKVTRIIKKNSKIFSIVSDISKPRVYKIGGRYYMNSSGHFMHADTYKRNYEDYSKEIKNKVSKILNMIKELTCDGDEEIFKLYMIYLGQIARGMKTEIVM